MDLRKKLARLSAPLPRSEPREPEPADVSSTLDPRAEKLAELRALIGGVVSRSERRLQRDEGPLRERGAALPWPTRTTAHGPVHLVERALDPEHCHGRAPVRGALFQAPRTLAALSLDAELAEIDLSRMLFLDTETTGLSGGTGTVAFLVGLARFEDGALCLSQLVLPNLGAEAPLLSYLAERLAEASCIVTYNGKTFDWPLLRTRFVLARMPVPPLPPHVDLLHATRRIWKPRLGSVRLTEIEREILRFEREGDIDGAEIPGRYFAFLREGGAERLAAVIEHNQNDLIALAAMLGVLAERFERDDIELPAEDALAFARLSLRADRPSRALSFAEAVQRAAGPDALSRQALELTSIVQRRAGDTQAAAEALERALDLAENEHDAGRLHFQLAKLYEHGLGDALRAHRHARHTEVVEGPHAHGRRMGRLRRRLLGQTPP